jgi:superfamily II DNA/RNA helicase
MKLFGSKRKGETSIDDEPRTAASAPQKPKERVVDAASYDFCDLGLCDWICASVRAMGFSAPTNIQRTSIPSILEGKGHL